MKLYEAVADNVENASANQSPWWPDLFTDNTNLVEDLEYLLPVKFREIMCSECRADVEKVKVYDGRRRTDGRTPDGAL